MVCVVVSCPRLSFLLDHVGNELEVDPEVENIQGVSAASANLHCHSHHVAIKPFGGLGISAILFGLEREKL